MSDERILLEDERPAVGERPRRSRKRRSRRGEKPVGRRVRLRRARRRRAAFRFLGWIVLLGLLGVGIVLGVAYIGLGDDGAPDGAPATDEPGAAGGDPQLAVAVATFDESRVADGASQIIVLAYEPSSGRGTVLLVPTGTVADVPGHGLLPIGRAYGFGQGPLLDATLDNLLGIDLDGAVGISRQGWAAVFTRIGGYSVDVPERLDERLEDGSSRVRFQAGPQFLDGPRLAELLTFEEAGDSELEQLPRIQLVLTGFLEQVAGEGNVLGPVFEDGAPMIDGAVPEEDLRALLEGLAAAFAEGDLLVRTLPVSPINSGEGESYRLAEDRAAELVDDRFAASVPTGEGEAGRALQILNGNGQPGIGADVAELLLPKGFRVVKTGNADRFDHQQTRIVIYSDEPEQIRAAERIRDLLGVGRVERSPQPLSVADITIVVGHDFLAQQDRDA